jgi:hypothetical protein
VRPAIATTAAAIVTLGLGIGFSQPADAAFIQYNSRAAFDALGLFNAVDWSLFGPSTSPNTTPDSRVVMGFGTQIDAHYIAGAYTGHVKLSSEASVLLFTLNFSGNNTGLEDNSAPFGGVIRHPEYQLRRLRGGPTWRHPSAGCGRARHQQARRAYWRCPNHKSCASGPCAFGVSSVCGFPRRKRQAAR